MPHGTVRDVIPAPASDVFDLLHDYQRRLEWDTLLQAAYLTDDHTQADLGAVSICRGKWMLGGIALKTRYVSFRRPEVAAVKMLDRPPLFEEFAATIRHQDLEGDCSSIEYVFHFSARPKWLRPVLQPLMTWVFAVETRKRLRALRNYFERQRQGTCHTSASK
ncbi:MAG: SRPBCC family protein [Planctomycetes bacterium]|nr:SRPBCC family protein [Planctomycetota bacterium]